MYLINCDGLKRLNHLSVYLKFNWKEKKHNDKFEWIHRLTNLNDRSEERVRVNREIHKIAGRELDLFQQVLGKYYSKCRVNCDAASGLIAQIGHSQGPAWIVIFFQ